MFKSELNMSEKAREAQRQYNNFGRWENLAKKKYGDAYEPPLPGQKMSLQAHELKRDYRRKIDAVYWEKIARNTKGV